MAWNTRTNLRSVETITQRVVAICRQMEDWRRILRHIERIEASVRRKPKGRTWSTRAA